ncbi:xylulokinase [Companilactobacillus kedongensis]|uniref:xylulokinase n=1 Tax=Companilactobacillus kedongensis TaxID=2486004 RepID=UPI000F78C10A|nr:FGGY-family carbohydrate kinase [Companilactobacillus kedongensis]
MANKLLLGIDVGTSSCKVTLFNLQGEAVAQESSDHNTYYPHDGWVEQDPMEWWDGICSSIQRIREQGKVDLNDISGIGLDGQSWSAIPVDDRGNVLDRTPIWMDTRADKICDEIGQKIGKEKIFNVSGNDLHPTYSLPKILWLKENKPDIFNKTAKFLQSNSFIGYKLTGVMSQDPSQSYGLYFYNMRTGEYDLDLLKQFGLDIDLFPELMDCDQVIGVINSESSKETGLPMGIPVVAGGLDAACGTLGAGVISSGQTQEQGGQSGGMSICLDEDEYQADPRLILSRHVIPNKLLLQGGTVGGAGVARWLLKNFCKEEQINSEKNSSNPFHEMDITAVKTDPGADGLIFLPYMSGERSPIWNAKAKGIYYGLDFSKTRGHMIRASYEGVAYSLEHNLQIAEESSANIQELYAMGGAANSVFWTQIKADVTGKRILVPGSDTATTLGAAILAGVATGAYSSYEDAIDKTIEIKKVYEPNPDNRAIYKEGFEKYLQIYNNLKILMK